MVSLYTITKSSCELWDDYLFLTKEMAKLLEKQDMDLFYELMEQRERLQKLIEDVVDDQFLLSPDGQQLLKEIQRINQNNVLKLQYIVNANRNQHNVSRAYDGVSADSAANRMNWET